VRRRFAGEDAAQAAFFLGRLAFDRGTGDVEAARYFELALTEQPQGPLAREATGRLLEAQLRLRDADAARTTSRLYLKNYPDGPHERTAERCLATP
jgi:TolA-binding protein